MSRGRHALPEPPRSDVPLLLLGGVVVAVTIGLVWVADESWAVQAGVTGLLVALAVVMVVIVRSSRKTTTALWREAMQQRVEFSDLQRELSDLRSHHTELLFELRVMRTELLASAEETARQVEEATDQRALMHDLLVPRQPVADPVYPSLHLPLVRAAFATELPEPTTRERTDTGVRTDLSGGEDVGGAEPQPPRQLLDLTASEIARLRRAN